MSNQVEVNENLEVTNHICDSELTKCYKCGTSVCAKCMRKINTAFGDWVCVDCFEDKEDMQRLIQQSHDDFNEAMESMPIESTITNESILTPEFVTFDDLKSQFEQKIPINQILTIKQYLPIMHKSVLINNIISSAKEIDDNGMTRINYTNLELFSTIHIIESFTNYAMHPETMIEEVDYIIENGIYDLIVKEIGILEYKNINQLLDRELDQIMKVENSIESVVNKHLYLIQDHIDVLISKIPNFEEKKVEQWIKSLGKTLKNIDPSKFALVQELSNFAKGTGK